MDADAASAALSRSCCRSEPDRHLLACTAATVTYANDAAA
jgi:hypothetical protein